MDKSIIEAQNCSLKAHEKQFRLKARKELAPS
jgi:hypothetical protein